MTRRATEAEVQAEDRRTNGNGQGRTEASPGSGPLKAGGRWSFRRKKEVVIRLIRGEPVDAVSREIGVEIFILEQWREEGMTGLETALKRRQTTPEQIQLDAAMKRVGELTMQNELLWKRVGSNRPLARRRS